jgi:hypothetical protein
MSPISKDTIEKNKLKEKEKLNSPNSLTSL